jgi:hypothetical protein
VIPAQAIKAQTARNQAIRARAIRAWAGRQGLTSRRGPAGLACRCPVTYLPPVAPRTGPASQPAQEGPPETGDPPGRNPRHAC